MATITHSFVSNIADNPQAKAAGEVLPSHWNAAHTDSSGNQLTVRTVLTANTNYYISTTGSDSNGGTNSSTDAWATLQHAANFISSNLDFAGFTVTINIGTGTFTGVGTKSTVGGGIIFWLGNGSANTKISNGPNDGIYNAGEMFSIDVECSSVTYINALTLKPSGSLPGASMATILIDGQFMNFGPLTPAGTLDVNFDLTNAGNNFSIFSNFAQSFMGLNFQTSATKAVSLTANNNTGFTFFTIESGGVFYHAGAWTITGTLSVNPSIFISNLGTWLDVGGSFAGGTVTGPRVSSVICGSIGEQFGASTLGPTFFPGDSFGTVDPSSSYDGFVGPLPGINTQTGAAYTLAVGDTLGIVEMNNAGANTLTVPTNASVAFEIGTKIWVTQIGAGATTIAGAGGVTVDNAGAVGGQWKSVKLYKRAINEWVQTNA